jgi:outer membrane protein assembly factor BamB
MQATPPVAVDGVVVIGTIAFNFQGSPTFDPLVWPSYDVITALRPSDGSVLWQRPNPGYNPVYGVERLSEADGILIVSNAGQLIAMRPSDGSVLWQIIRGSVVPPVVDRGVIYANDDQGLYATRLSDGKLLWQLPEQLLWQLSPLAATAPIDVAILRPVVSGDVLYSGSIGRLVALHASDGVILWQTSVATSSPTPTPTPNPTGRNHLYVPGPSPSLIHPLAVVGGHLYVSADIGLLLVRTSDGQVDGLIASQPRSHTVVPILIDGTLYFAVTDGAPTQTTFSLQTSDQKLLWRVPPGVPGGAIVAAEDGVIYLDSGVIVESEDGIVYLDSGSLLAIRLSDGTVLWHASLAPLPGGLAASDGGHLYISQLIGYEGRLDTCAASNVQLGTVTQLSKKDGSISWVAHIPAARLPVVRS